jgi:hypothetical protein
MWDSDSIDPCILYLGTTWRWVSFTPRSLYPHGRSPWCPLDRRLDGSQSQYRRHGEGSETLPLPVLQPVASHCPGSLLIVLTDKLNKCRCHSTYTSCEDKFPTGFSSNILHSPVYFLIQIRSTEINNKLKVLIQEFYFLQATWFHRKLVIIRNKRLLVHYWLTI